MDLQADDLSLSCLGAIIATVILLLRGVSELNSLLVCRPTKGASNYVLYVH